MVEIIQRGTNKKFLVNISAIALVEPLGDNGCKIQLNEDDENGNRIIIYTMQHYREISAEIEKAKPSF